MWIKLFVSVLCFSKVYTEPAPAVAIVVGGVGLGEITVELYSPDDKCNIILNPINASGLVELRRPVLALNGNKVVVCGGGGSNRICWNYLFNENTWSEYTKSNHAHDYKPGVVHNAVLYIVDDQNAEKFDFNANKWSYWDSPPKPVGFDPCMVELNSKLYLLGGSQHETGIQVYDIATNEWTVLSEQTPFPIIELSCTTFSNNTIIVVGKDLEKENHEVGATFSVETGEWKSITNEKFRLQDALVRLNERVFVIGGLSDFTEEYKDGKLEDTSSKLKKNRLLASAMGIPASLVPSSAGSCLGIP